ncbi:nicotinate-nucleotide adenylyltransferase [Rhodovulum adriaticum]|uniref:Probable nicotinate-nucleotide adenylyltransferase n=1 Tax=Rhodovulum adriaticum TaxID=35804 RepID=A0A4R2NIA4_RHOAD|nr:nicotinate-nucleotide adenylyltransferase [Rhodovulum adriaticum]MBK1635423.1 nicotinic acid mononucleotide adenylyltransferase [Rhodovulum adriaticum]TCP21131.1 nicotinate-nucleotide adenylyltransferase [Rhodovulum adriaticum]
MRTGFPKAAPGMRIGLLGGSFDPAHEGHAHITRAALKGFGLDRVWWLVSPGNPLKPEGPAPMARRIAAAERIMHDPRVTITDIEARLGTRYTAATLGQLRTLYPGVHFVWLMGADNLMTFHRWDRWEWILQNVPVGVLARPGQGVGARRSRAAIAFARYRVPATHSRALALRDTPAWCFLNVPLVHISSSDIRARGEW